MNGLMGLTVAAIKASVSDNISNEILKCIVQQGISFEMEAIKKYLVDVQKELNEILTDRNLMIMNLPKDKIHYIRDEIKNLLLNIDLKEETLLNCQYDADSLATALYCQYLKQKDSVDYGDEIRIILKVIADQAIRQSDGFISNGLERFTNFQKDQINLLNHIFEKLEKYRNHRLPDRTDEYCRKWNKNMFLNDFDDEEDSRINIPLCTVYQPMFYRMKDQIKILSNLSDLLDRFTQGQDSKNRMLLILGQVGMGKTTMITWFINQYQQRTNIDKKEILVYRFTDFDINWEFEIDSGNKRGTSVASAILECLNMKKEDLNGKIFIFDGFNEVVVGANRAEILNCLYNAWALDSRIKNFSLLITCRENYIEDLSRLSFPYITLQPWNTYQIESFCRNYGSYAQMNIMEESIEKIKEMNSVFGIPILLYMALALNITVRDDSSVVEVYDQIFSLKEGIYDRYLNSDASIRWDNAHHKIKKQIHQFYREISLWMFENNPEQAAIPQNEYEKIWNKIFGMGDNNRSGEETVLSIGFLAIIRCYNGLDVNQFRFVHRSFYEYFVAETISSEISETASDMEEETQVKLAEVLGQRLKKGRITYTIGQYLKIKVCQFTATFDTKKKNRFFNWLEGAVEKILNFGIEYYVDEHTKDYKNLIEREMICFENILDVLRLFFDFSDKNYIIQNVIPERKVFYIRNLTSVVGSILHRRLDLSRIELCETELNGVYLRGANLRKASLNHSNLIGTDLIGIELLDSSLVETDLIGADLTEADLTGANLTGADLRRANLQRAVLNQAEINSVDLRGATLIGADLTGADLTGSDLTGADLTGANLTEANLRSANLHKAVLNQAEINSVDLKDATLMGADLNLVNLNFTDLTNADLELTSWYEEDIKKYFELIMKGKFQVISIYYKESGKKSKITREELLIQYLD